MRAAIAILAALALTGCATAPVQPIVQIKTVEVPVAIKCVTDPAPVVPAFVDTPEAIAAAPDVFARAKLYVVGRLQRIGYEGELAAALKGCTG